MVALFGLDSSARELAITRYRSWEWAQRVMAFMLWIVGCIDVEPAGEAVVVVVVFV